jgi:hypothetical protein
MKKKREAEAKAAAAAAEAEALRLKAEKEAREFAEVFARKAKIFALEEQSKAKRKEFFGRPAQQCRLQKMDVHAVRMRWEQQAAM